ncbi:hypothetical protein ACWQEN_000234 [Morganella morganii]|uniref:Uncharacterized protein n=1 Tax=bacterium 19GA11TI05 TaxID=2920688 RepID=A0AAU6TZJ2_UNCXX|nr:hypothetical protein [Morganella morganii]MDW7792955.1 hypothetical protein [Morganella morganii]WNP32129.1 hypothetical protein RN616_07905 [Morganella morganii]HDS3818158.1 hypothetical protein [Morganella morganii subsp. morganii]
MMEYPRRIGKRSGSGGTYDENYQRALKSAIEQMDLQRRGKPTGEPSLSEQRIAETLHNICRITALHYPPLPENIKAARNAAETQAWREWRTEHGKATGVGGVDYYGGGRAESRPGQRLGD